VGVFGEFDLNWQNKDPNFQCGEQLQINLHFPLISGFLFPKYLSFSIVTICLFIFVDFLHSTHCTLDPIQNPKTLRQHCMDVVFAQNQGKKLIWVDSGVFFIIATSHSYNRDHPPLPNDEIIRETYTK
jgi:hypothetical protein